MLLKYFTQYVSKFGKPSSWYGTGKGQFSTQSERRTMKYYTTALISHTTKAMLKILKVRLQQYMNWELPNAQVGFRKGIRTRDKIVNVCWIMEIAREFQKNICFIDYTKAFDCVDHNKLWKILKRWEYQTTWPISWETYMHVRKQQLELAWTNRPVPNRKRSTSRLYIVTLLI